MCDDLNPMIFQITLHYRCPWDIHYLQIHIDLILYSGQMIIITTKTIMATTWSM